MLTLLLMAAELGSRHEHDIDQSFRPAMNSCHCADVAEAISMVAQPTDSLADLMQAMAVEPIDIRMYLPCNITINPHFMSVGLLLQTMVATSLSILSKTR